MGWRDHLKVHPACEMFPPLSRDELIDLGEDIKQNKIRERIKLVPDGDGYAVLDGRSRLDAIEAVGLEVKVFIKDKPNGKFFEVVVLDVDPFDFVVSANLMRRHMTNEAKRLVIAALLERWPDRSNRRIAKQVGVSHPTVGIVRESMERRGKITTSESLTDTKGREQPAHKAPAAPPDHNAEKETEDPGAPRSDAQTQGDPKQHDAPGGDKPATTPSTPTSAAGQSAAAPASAPPEGQPEPSAGRQQAKIREAQEERQHLLDQIAALKAERRDLAGRLNAAMTDPVSIAEALGEMSPDQVSAVMSKLVTDHIPADPRKRQEWSKAACGWIQNIYGKLTGPKENPWRWRQRVHRLIKLPAGIDLGKPGQDEVGNNTTTATDADFERQVAPPRPAGELPKVSDSADYRRLAPPGSLLKDKPPSGRNGLGIPSAAPSPASAAPMPEEVGRMSPAAKEFLAEIVGFDGPAGKLIDMWRLNRARRNELTPEDQQVVNRVYQARFNELNKTEGVR